MANIEKNIPAPDRSSTFKILPLADMEIGDSVYVDDLIGSYGATRTRVAKENRRKIKRFVTRREGYGTRVWRVE